MDQVQKKSRRIGSARKGSIIAGGFLLISVIVVLRINEEYMGHACIRSLRTLTFWNLILSSLFLIFSPFFPPKALLVCGLAIIGLNLFVLLARSLLLRFRKDTKPIVWFGDIFTHYLVPIFMSIFVFIFFSVQSLSPSNKQLAFGGLALFVTLLMWMMINAIVYAWRKTWPYKRHVGNFSQDKSWKCP